MTNSNGYSLIEVLVALVVLSIMCSALVSLNCKNQAIISASNSIYDSINIFQELSAKKGLRDLEHATGSWLEIEKGDKVFWKASVENGDLTNWNVLKIRDNGHVSKWLWPIAPD